MFKNKLKKIAFLLLFFTITVSSVRVSHAGTSLYDFANELIFKNVTSSVTTFFNTAFLPSIADIPYALIYGCDSGQIEDLKAGQDVPCFNIPGFGAQGAGGMVAVSSYGLQNAVDSPPPVNLAYYFKDLRADSLVFKEANAAGVDSTFDRVLGIWKAVRNIAYGLLAIVVLVISIMISNRSKIDAQNVVTAQAMIPRIIISAVLITFSYAIGGLFIQMGGLFGPIAKTGFYVLNGSFSESDITINAPNVDTAAIKARYCQDPFTDNVPNMSVIIPCVAVGTLYLGTNTIALTVFVVASGILLVVLAFATIFIYLTRYFRILLLTVFAPIIFVIAILPGQEDRIKNWFKDLAGAVLGVPAMLFVVLLGLFLFLSVAWTNDANTIVGVGQWFDNAWRGIIGAVMMWVTWVYALKVPGLVDNFIKGPPKKK